MRVEGWDEINKSWTKVENLSCFYCFGKYAMLNFITHSKNIVLNSKYYIREFEHILCKEKFNIAFKNVLIYKF